MSSDIRQPPLEDPKSRTLRIEPFRTTTLLTFVIGLAEIVCFYALGPHTPDLRARLPFILDSLAIYALGLFVLSGIVGLALIWRLTVGAIPGVIAGAFASLGILDTGLVPRLIPVTHESGPQYAHALVAVVVVGVALGISRRRLGATSSRDIHA